MGATAKTADFSKVKDGGGAFSKKRMPEGDYEAIITKVEDSKVKDSGDFQYLFTIQLVKNRAATYPYYCQLTEKTLWKLRNLMIAAGKAVPKSKIKVDPNVVVGKHIGITLSDTEWDDKEQSQIDAVFPVAELGDVDEDDDEADESTDDAEDTLDEDDTSDIEDEPAEEEEDIEDDVAEGDEWDAITDRTELRKALKKVAPDVKTNSGQSEDDIRDLIRAAIADAAGDEEEELEEDEEEEAPPAPKKAAKSKKAAKKPVDEVSDDELEELDVDDL